MNTAGLLDLLHASLAETYPTYRAVSARPGRVTCVVEADSGAYDQAVCAPTGLMVTANIRVLAAGDSEQAVKDLPHHIDPVATLIRQAGFAPTGWRSGESESVPEITITAEAPGVG